MVEVHCVSKKVSHLTFNNKFGKCGPILKIFFPIYSYGIFLRVHHIDFHITCNTLLQYVVKSENPKLLRNFHIERDS